MTKLSLPAAIIAACAFATTAQAQNLLDQQLGGPSPTTPSAPTSPAAQPEATPAASKDTPPVPQPDAPKDPAAQSGATSAPPLPPVGGSDIVSPDAVKKVDDADLINKLTRTEDAPQGPPIAQQMSDMIDRMGESEKRLTGKDAGDVTQETQRRILTDLDVLIEYARQQQQQGGPSKDPSKSQQQGQQRTYSQGQQNQGGTQAANSSFLPGGNAATPSLNDDIHSRGPNEWGGLRPRERDLISHGANEEYLSAYRDMIDRYYQALAELGKSHSH